MKSGRLGLEAALQRAAACLEDRGAEGFHAAGPRIREVEKVVALLRERASERRG